ncbi:excalibur calcium-binding domain-containing protein [Rothia amarae]|uniref:Excalibur calcium-binding domain-containing protein n=1 Tax=Rothia amarae TaxID=169480 RepID=A0A7H2BJC7_9MICC|nr:excalibur calcium-binding domain-containing protein [Rothia amarae]QNV39773.1 excalibur calcium-binding domain-containing protein [Rothia amarae]
MSQVKIGNRSGLKVASVASATIALLATGTLAPALAADDANQQVVSATAAVVANSAVNLADGVLIETAENPTIAADGTSTGLATVESAEIQNLEIILESAKTELTVGTKDTVKIAENSVGAAIKAYPNARVLGAWTVSDPSILTVTPQGAIEAKAPGTATVTFTSAEVSQGVVTEGTRSVTLEITVVAAEEPTPAVTETPAPVETAAPAPTAPEAPAPVASETPAPVASETAAPVETATPAPAEVTVTSAAAADAPTAPAETAEAPAPVAAQAPAPTDAVATSAVAAEAPASQAVAPRAAAASTSVYENCADVHAKLGREIHQNEVGYEPKLDRDGDGVGCELTPDYENTQNGSEQTVVNQGGSENTSSTNGIYPSDDSRSADSLASSDPANAYYGSTETTLANTGFSAMGIFAGGMTLLGLGTAAVVTSRRKAV